MTTAAAARPRHLLLLGGGHAHLHVLRDFAVARPAHVRITLVSPFPDLVYSGMVPGLVAGRYRADECRIALAPLAERAGVDFVSAEATAIDAAARRVTIVHAEGARETVRYDVISLDIGGVMPVDAIAGAASNALVVRPIERFVDALDARLAGGAAPPRDVVVIGGGAGGVELALALRARLADETSIALVAGGPLLASHSAALRRRAWHALARRQVGVQEDNCTAVASDHLRLGNRRDIACDLAVVAIGSAAPPWLRDSGISLDGDGFVATAATLQSLSHPEVFAAGDVATRPDAPRPRNGVHAVRAGRPLTANLRRLLAGRPCIDHRPQRNALALLSCGDGSAIAEWDGWSIEGRAIGRLKDRIDRRFVALSRAA